VTRPGDWWRVVAVAGIAFAASLSGLPNALVQDDAVLILRNPLLQDLGNWRAMFTSSYWPPPWDQDLYRPLTSLVLAAQFDLGGGNPLVYRLVSYALYAAVSAGVYLLGRRLLPGGIAFGLGLLFAAHPVHVEAVALGVGQSELLVGGIALLMTALYLRGRQGGAMTAGQWLQLGGLYLAACLIKEQGLLLPGLLVAAELLLRPAGPERTRGWIGGLGFLAGLGAVVVGVRVLLLGGVYAGNYVAEALQGLGFGERLLTLLAIVPRWALLLLWPAHLQADYSPREIEASAGFGGAEALGLGLLLLTGALAWTGRRRAPVVAFGIGWAALGLLPVSNLLVPTGILLAERTLFLPSIGVMLALGGLADWLLRRLGTGKVPAVRIGLAAATGLLLAAGLMKSARRHPVWRSEAVLAEQSAADAPQSYRMQTAYGYTLFEAGLRERGIEAYRRAISLAPAGHVWRVRNDLARRYFAEGNMEAAVSELEASLADDDSKPETWNYLILAHLTLGHYDQAARLADAALARGGALEMFGSHRALADSAARHRLPPGSIRIRVNR
jgi:tetratricopeptide (TPR) repeat protein